MKFFFPDSQDQIDPLFDMDREEHSPFRVRQRDDRYAHEVLATVPFDGILVSKAIVDGWSRASGKYTDAQRARFYREGVRGFFRLDGVSVGQPLRTLGDCGAFAYVEEDVPPYAPDDVIDFYHHGRFDMGISPDHVILGFQSDESGPASDKLADWATRQKVTLELASAFLARHAERGCAFEPVGAAQGWSPSSYAFSVAELQSMGYTRIALGGMVPLKTKEILAALRAIDGVRARGTQLHLLGVTRLEHLSAFVGHGVTSFDSTSPFRQAFMDAEDNYYGRDGNLMAVRVPQVDGNSRLKMAIRAGRVRQSEARELERNCLMLLRAFARKEVGVDDVLEALAAYSSLLGASDRSQGYRRTLESRAWESCDCGVCAEAGIEVVIFRGSERNKRRGFHNLHVFRERLAAMQRQEVAR